MNLFYKVIFAFFSVLLLFSALVQFNDPDPIHWVFLYGFSSLLCGFAIFGKYNRTLVILSFGAVLLQLLIVVDGAYIWFQHGMENMLATPMSANKPYIEEIREFLGTLIVGISNVLLFWRATKK